MRLYHLVSVFLILVAARAADDAVVTEGKINVRGKPSLIGEVITQLERGEKVTVLERLTNSTAQPGEPTNWAKITLPPNTPVWVFAPFVKDGVVSVSRLNIRAGRGENYSVIGRIERGTPVKTIRTVQEWMEIEQPTNAYAFIALDLLDLAEDSPSTTPVTTSGQPPTIASQTTPISPATNEIPSTITQPTPAPETAPTAAVPSQPETSAATTNESVTVASTIPAEPTEQPDNVARPQDQPVSPTPDASTGAKTIPAIIPETEAPPATAETTLPQVSAPTTTVATTPRGTNETVATQVRETAPASPLPPAENFPKVAPPVAKRTEVVSKRVVRREGIVRATTSIQAPTWYELIHADTKKRINYLFDENMGINLKDYRGQKVVVTGEEAIDSRWPNSPILDMQSLDVLPNDDAR